MRMKTKSILAIAFFTMALLPISLNAGERGAQLTRAENPKCESGVMANCTGSGNHCDYTSGWDCEAKNVK